MASFQSSTSKGYKLSLDVSEASTNQSNNSSGVNWALRVVATSSYCQYNPGPGTIKVSINGKQVYSGTPAMVFPGPNSIITVCSGSMTIAHDSDGSKTIACSASYTASASASYLPGNMSCSGNFALTSFPMATTPTFSATTVAVGSSVTITLPRAVNTFKHIVMYHINGKSGFVSHEAADSVAWTVPEDVLDAMPNSTSGTCDIEVQTYTAEGSYIGAKDVNIALTVPSSYKPTIGAPTISEATSGIASQFSAFVQSKSTLKIVTPVTQAKGATLKSCTVKVDGYTYSGTTVTTGVINSSGDLSLSITATDSRGRTATRTQSVTIKPYSSPKISIAAVSRADADGTLNESGTYLKCQYAFKVSPVGNKNTHSFKIQKKNGSSWKQLTSIDGYEGNSAYITSATEVFSVDQEYNIRFLVSDFFESYSIEKTVGTSYTLINFGADGKSIACGMVSDLPGTFQNALPVGQAHRTTTSGSDGYVKALRLTTGPVKWNYSGIEFKYHSGALTKGFFDTGKIVINGGDTTDPTPAYKVSTNPSNPFWIYKSAANTWDVYVTKTGDEQVAIFGVTQYVPKPDALTWEFTNEWVSSLPSGAIKSTWEYLDACYPVGSVIMSTSSTNPGDRLGGTWVQDMQGRTPIGVGSGSDGSTSKTFSVNSTGGKYEFYQVETQSPWKRSSSETTADVGLRPGGAYSQRVAVSMGGNVASNTASQSISLMQPYKAVYMWRRTA